MKLFVPSLKTTWKMAVPVEPGIAVTLRVTVAPGGTMAPLAPQFHVTTGAVGSNFGVICTGAVELRALLR